MFNSKKIFDKSKTIFNTQVHIIFFAKFLDFTNKEIEFIITYYARIFQIMTDKLDKKTAYSKIRNIFNKKVLIVVGTGASIAVDQKFGMPPLAKELGQKMPDVVSSDKKLKSS